MIESVPFDIIRDLNNGLGRVFGRVTFIAVADITDAIAVIASVAVVNFFKIPTTLIKLFSKGFQ